MNGTLELAVRLRSVAALPDFRARRGGPGAAGPLAEPAYAGHESWISGLAALDAKLGALPVSRVYIGAEFCEHLLPSTDELAAECARAVAEGVALTLVTPPVGDEGVAKVLDLAKVLAVSGVRGPELVLNDWGSLDAVSEAKIAGLALVVGRCLVKFQKDPAVVEHYKDSPEKLRMSSVAGGPLRRLLDGTGVARVEVDALPQGFPGGVADETLAASAHVPYGYVSTGRVCLVGSLALPRLERFTPQTKCPRPCEGLDAEMRAPSVAGGTPERLRLKGNTAFFHMGWEAASRYADEALARGADRVVVTPTPEA